MWATMSAHAESRSGGPRLARGAPAGTVIVGRPCHSVGFASNEIISAGAPAPTGHQGALAPATSSGSVAALASTARQIDAGTPGPCAATDLRAAELSTSHGRITRSLGVAAQDTPEPGTWQRAPTPTSARAQSLNQQRALAEARHGQARRARARRRSSRPDPSDTPLGMPHPPPSPRRRARSRRWSVVLGALGLPALASLALVAWPATLHVPGVLLGAGARSVEPAFAGVVEEVLLQPGAEVSEGQLLVRLEAARTIQRARAPGARARRAAQGLVSRQTRRHGRARRMGRRRRTPARGARSAA